MYIYIYIHIIYLYTCIYNHTCIYIYIYTHTVAVFFFIYVCLFDMLCAYIIHIVCLMFLFGFRPAAAIFSDGIFVYLLSLFGCGQVGSTLLGPLQR